VRRTILLLAVVATATLLTSGIALAVNKISCPNKDANLCIGTKDPDVMSGTLDADAAGTPAASVNSTLDNRMYCSRP
jgi:outer membrane murein-binding lipoprotein Lpp